MPKNGEVKLSENNHRYSIYKDGTWYHPPSFSAIKGNLKQPWAIGYGAKCSTNYLINKVIPLLIYNQGNLPRLIELCNEAVKERGLNGSIENLENYLKLNNVMPDLILTEEDLQSEHKDGLIKTAKRQPKIHSGGEAQIGTDAHDSIERHILTATEPIGLSFGANNAYNSYLLWENANKHRIGKTYLTEVPLYCKKFDFCFKPDRVFDFDEKLTYQDYKSSADFYDEDNALQHASYIYGMEENIENGNLAQYGLPPGTKFHTAGTLWLDKIKGTIAKWKDYKAWLECALLEFVQLRDLHTTRKDLRGIRGLSY